jgi:hypothetical protein
MSDEDELFRLARADIPERYAHPVCTAIAPSGQFAIALIAANEQPIVEIDLSLFEREEGRWVLSGSGGASGVTWSSAGPYEDVLTAPVAAPPDAGSAVFEWRGQEHNVAVENGYATLVLWNEPVPLHHANIELPQVRYFILDDGTNVRPADDGAR